MNKMKTFFDDSIDKFEYSEGEYFYNDVNKHLFYVANCEQSNVILNYKKISMNKKKHIVLKIWFYQKQISSIIKVVRLQKTLV